MRYISPANITYLKGNYQTLCLCVKMTLRDGTVLGFTDLDVDLTVSAVVYRSKVGLFISALRWSNKLDDEKTEISGLFSDLTGGLTEELSRTGYYNEADVEIFLANWSTSALIVPLKRGKLCNIIPSGVGYTAEVRSLFYPLSKRLIVRPITFDCNAELGDSRCTKLALNYDGVVTDWVSQSSLVAAGFFVSSGFADESEIIGGRFIFTNSDFNWFENKVKTFDSATDTFTFWRPFTFPYYNLSEFTVYEGCDRKPTTCKVRFNNLLNFRGFQFTPDKDETAIPRAAQQEDGGYVVGYGEDD